MPRFLFALLCLLSTVASANEDMIIYFNRHWIKCNESEAVYYRNAEEKDGKYLIVDYTMAGRKVATGTLSEKEDLNLRCRHGAYVFYDSCGKKEREGEFVNGRREGIWKSYIPCSTHLLSETHYVYNVIQKSTIYNDSMFEKSSETEYERGVLLYKKNYEHGKLVSEMKGDGMKYTYYDDGAIKKKEQYKEGKLISRKVYNKIGSEIPDDGSDDAEVADLVEVMPNSVYDVLGYLSEHLEYPAKAQNKKIQGRVEVKFVVYEDGSIHDAEIVVGAHPLLDEAALKVIEAMPPWKPGMQNGKKVKVFFTQPITFKL